MGRSFHELAGRPLLHDAARVEHRDPVCQLQDFVKFRGHDHDRRSVVTFGDDALVDELDRADVKPACGLRSDEQPERTGELPGQDHLLLVAAGEGAHRGGDGGRADVEFLDLPGRVLRDHPRFHPHATGEGRLVVEVQDHVLGDGERTHQAVKGAVLGDEAHARTEDVTKDEVLGMIILGKVPSKAIPGPGAMQI